MNRILRYLVVALVLATFTAIGSEPIDEPGLSFFEGSFDEALDYAKQEDLPLFMYLTMPNCSPCEFMETKVFPNPSIGEFMNARFVSVKLDAYDEEANGPALAKRYHVGSYPTYLILDHDGKVTHRATSSMSATNFIRTISWLTGETTSPMEEFDAKYAAGDRDPDFVQQYLLDSRLEMSLLPKDLANWEANMEAYSKLQEKYTAITNEYLASKSSKDLINSRDLSIIHAYCKNLDETGIKLVIDNFDAYVDATSLQQVSGLLLEVVYYSAMTRAFEGDSSYIEVLDLLEEEPLKQAVAWRRSVDPESGQLPENQRDHLANIFSSAKEEATSESPE